MHQIAEIPTTERIVAEILDDSASIGVGMRFLYLAFGQSRVSLEQKRADLVGPHQIHDLLVGQDRICERTTAADEHDKKERRTTATKHPPALCYGAWRCWQVTHTFKSCRGAGE
jgi:hypothetical protein